MILQAIFSVGGQYQDYKTHSRAKSLTIGMLKKKEGIGTAFGSKAGDDGEGIQEQLIFTLMGKICANPREDNNTGGSYKGLIIGSR